MLSMGIEYKGTKCITLRCFKQQFTLSGISFVCIHTANYQKILSFLSITWSNFCLVCHDIVISSQQSNNLFPFKNSWSFVQKDKKCVSYPLHVYFERQSSKKNHTISKFVYVIEHFQIQVYSYRLIYFPHIKWILF